MVRRTGSIMAAMGIAMIVMILFILFGFVDGMRRTTQREAEDGNYIVLSKGAEAEPYSVIMQPQLEQLRILSSFGTDGTCTPLLSLPPHTMPHLKPHSPNTIVFHL